MKISKIVAFCLFTLVNSPCLAQTSSNENFPVVGKSCPDFELNNISYFSLKRASLGDLRNKRIILEFFSAGCDICFIRMPKINQIQKEFKDKIQIILVGKDDRFIRNYYEKFRRHYGLNLPVVYDTLLFRQFQIDHVPYAIWIDGNGIVKAVTTNIERDEALDFIAGKSLHARLCLNSQQESALDDYYNDQKPLLIDGNGGSDTAFLFRSLLAKWDPKSSFHYDDYISSRDGKMIQMTGIPLYFLYRLAYGDTVPFTYPRMIGQAGDVQNHYGNWKYFPVLEMSDTSLFQFSSVTGDNLYSYSLIVPEEKANAHYLQQIMRNDLKNYFGFSVRVERRSEPYFKITSTAVAKRLLKTKGEKPVFDADFIHLLLVNRPVKDLISDLDSYYQTQMFVDETGIKDNIDLEFSAIMTDLNDIKKAIRKKGLILEQGLKEMNVIVIRDPVNETAG
ncbi:MAG: TlpA disulfide reductase family protein [Bacteroidota bacterium]|nr:TlpA disulfide reductase family protein [Bacteroidota bacterium]MDP4212618.1 TlpA disulfide reductase family protein [Bacteroidota bacterium]MDP4248676.1 TlpA disulfide reductase family protein [Bacteroidota bacterium]